MKLKKAIEIGELNINEAGKGMPTDTLTALKLLVEAGKREQILRWEIPYERDRLLPGETNE